MRSLVFVLLIGFSRILFAGECSELSVNYATDEIIELQGLTSCQLRGSLFLLGSSNNLAKEVNQNFYECRERKIDVIVERYRSEEVSKWLVSAIQLKDAQELTNVAFVKNKTSLENFISDIEINNRVSCVEVNTFIFNVKRYFKCGRAKLAIEVSPYVLCTDAWRSL